MLGPANRMMAGYATPYARVSDERNKLMLPFDHTPPSVVTPGEVPDVPMPGWPAPMVEPDFSGMPEMPMPLGAPGQMPPPSPGLHGKGFVSGAPPLDDSWSGRLRRLQGGDNDIDPRMEKQPPEPAIPGPGYTMRGVPQENLIQQAPGGVQVEGWLPANATQAPMNPNDPRYVEWLRLMRRRGSI